MKTNGNDLASPIQFIHEHGELQGTQEFHEGLTKRELFAAMAMQGLVRLLQGETMYSMQGVVGDSVNIADLLIAQLNK